MHPALTLSRLYSKREPLLDFLRGIAVLLMILAHSIYFFHNDSSDLLRIIARSSNAVVFTIFLFVSGASLYFSFLKNNEGINFQKAFQIIKRCLYLLAGFYIVSIAAVLKDINFFDFNSLSRVYFEIFTFMKFPRFSEFLLPYIILWISVIFLKPFYLKISKNIIFTICFSTFIFLLGFFLYPLLVPTNFRFIKAIFVGEEGILAFPLFQYFPVFLLGINFGKKIFSLESIEKRKQLAYALGFTGVIVLIICSYLSNFYPISFLNPFNRWPPSVGFLSIGIAATMFLTLIYYLIIKPSWSRYFWSFIDYLGKDAYDLYIVHITVLFFYEYLVGAQFSNLFIIGFLYILLIVVSSFLSSINWVFSPSLFTIRPISLGVKGTKRIKKRYIAALVILNAIILWNLNSDRRVSAFGDIVQRERIIGIKNQPLEEIKTEEKRETLRWFNDDYGYYIQINIKNNDVLSPIKTRDTIKFEFDYINKIKQQKVNENGEDLYLVYFIDDKYLAVPFKFENMEDGRAIINFSVAETIYPSRNDNRYFLYYGSDFPLNRSGIDNTNESTLNYQVSLGKEVIHPIPLTLNRRWFLKSYPSYLGKDDLVLSITDFETNNDVSYTYEILDSGINGELSSDLGTVVSATIDVIDLPAKEYTVSVYKNINKEKVSQRRLKINVSYPLYVSWSLDWEGWDVENAVLTSLSEMVEKHYNIPLTHFFNPRIYLENIMPTERTRFLTDWVLNRKEKYKDEIAMHLHMHSDMVKEIGVDPRKEPKWNFKNSEGYDVLTTAYTDDEFLQMIFWAKTKFKDNALGEPIGYRAGGWFIDSGKLKILEDYGFKYDSSGRDKIMWAGAYSSPWDLNSISQPYYPEVDNQNISSKLNSLNILEIPNNGGNDYEYSANILIKRFYQNFQGFPLTDMKSYVFMSHPQWHSTTNFKIESLLQVIDKYLYGLDKGPVIYVTLEDIYNIWKK